jgi:hypothetical protein
VLQGDQQPGGPRAGLRDGLFPGPSCQNALSIPAESCSSLPPRAVQAYMVDLGQGVSLTHHDPCHLPDAIGGIPPDVFPKSGRSTEVRHIARGDRRPGLLATPTSRPREHYIQAVGKANVRVQEMIAARRCAAAARGRPMPDAASPSVRADKTCRPQGRPRSPAGAPV